MCFTDEKGAPGIVTPIAPEDLLMISTPGQNYLDNYTIAM